VDAFEGLELLHEAFAAERVLALAVEGDAGGGVGDVDRVEFEVAVGVVDGRGEQPFGPGEAPAGGVGGGDGPAAGDEESVLAEGAGVGVAVAAGEFEGVGQVVAGGREVGAPASEGGVADLLQGEEVGRELVEAGEERAVEGGASVGDVER
jgi:hypothetical protein